MLSAERRHQSPEWTVLSQVNCVTHIEVAGFQILLNGFHPCNTRTSQWSPPVSCGTSWHQHVCNDEVRRLTPRLTKQPHLSAIVQSRRLSLFGHIARMPDEADAKQILRQGGKRKSRVRKRKRIWRGKETEERGNKGREWQEKWRGGS